MRTKPVAKECESPPEKLSPPRKFPVTIGLTHFYSSRLHGKNISPPESHLAPSPFRTLSGYWPEI